MSIPIDNETFPAEHRRTRDEINQGNPGKPQSDYEHVTTIDDMADEEAPEASHISAHHAFAGIVASVQLSPADYQHLVENGYVTVHQHRDPDPDRHDSIIEVTIKR